MTDIILIIVLLWALVALLFFSFLWEARASKRSNEPSKREPSKPSNEPSNTLYYVCCSCQNVPVTLICDNRYMHGIEVNGVLRWSRPVAYIEHSNSYSIVTQKGTVVLLK